MMSINFESSTDIEKARQWEREAREAVLEKAQKDYEKRQARKELAKLRGEDKWMLPELDEKLSGSKSNKSKKRKKEKKEKKHKKDKKSKKKKQKDDSSTSDSDEWVEKTNDTSALPATPLQREDWMSVPSLLPTFSKDSVRIKRTSTKNDEEETRKKLMEMPGQTSRELNPYWKNGGSGLPPESKETQVFKNEKTQTVHKNLSNPNRFRRPSEGDECNHPERKRFASSNPGWKKKEQTETYKKEDKSSSSSSESEEDNESPLPEKDNKVWTEQELNALNAKIIKAEIMGQEELVKSLKSTLARARESVSRSKEPTASSSKEHVAVLTKTNAKGGQHPLPAPRYGEESLKGSKGKGKRTKVETHQSGERVRYFADDDKYSLSQMFQREKLDTSEDHNAMFSRLVGKKAEQTNDDFDMDDMFVSRANRQVDEVAAEERERQNAIAEHRNREKVLDSCTSCLDSQRIQKHLIVAIGQKCYLSLPTHQSLVDGHCYIVPRTHVTCSTQLDEDVWEEIQMFRQALTKMFLAEDADAIFFETAMNLKRFPHMMLECIPLSMTAGETAPIYFKKALLECESEWAMNKKVIDLHGKDVRKAVPKGLPYFFVDFGMQSGFAHIIEDEQRFSNSFAQEILGGILDLEPHKWRRPVRENFDQQKRKVLDFAAKWKRYDFTSKN